MINRVKNAPITRASSAGATPLQQTPDKQYNPNGLFTAQLTKSTNQPINKTNELSSPTEHGKSAITEPQDNQGNYQAPSLFMSPASIPQKAMNVNIEQETEVTLLPEISTLAQEVNDLENTAHAVKIEDTNILKYIEENNLDQETIQAVMDSINVKHNKRVHDNQRVDLKIVLFALKMCKITQSFPLFLPKADTKFSHSILLYKEEDNYHILIKPNLQINNLSHLDKLLRGGLVANGSYKIVKMTGLEIQFDANKTLLKVQPVVTVSRSPKDLTKGSNLILQSENLKADNFKEIKFSTAQNGKVEYRHIFVKNNLGVNLRSLRSDIRRFNLDARIEVMIQLCDKVNSSIHDIKLANTCLDGKTVNFIDYISRIFTYTTKYGVASFGDNGIDLTPDQIDQITEQQIFGLALMCYQLLEPDIKVIAGTGHDHEKPEFLALSPNNPFSELVQAAYLEQIPKLDTCKNMIRNIIYPSDEGMSIKDKLGTNLRWLRSDIQNFNMKARIEMMSQLCEKIHIPTGDIKLENICWDGKRISFNDDKIPEFKYTTKYGVAAFEDNGIDLTPDQIDQITEQQIFGLALVCYQLLAPYGREIAGTGNNHKKPESLALSANNPFAELVQAAYLEGIQELDTCAEIVWKILRTQEQQSQPN